MTKHKCILCKKRERRHGNLYCKVCRNKSTALRFAALQELEHVRIIKGQKGNPIKEQRNDQKTTRKRYFVLSPRSC